MTVVNDLGHRYQTLTNCTHHSTLFFRFPAQGSPLQRFVPLLTFTNERVRVAPCLRHSPAATSPSSRVDLDATEDSQSVTKAQTPCGHVLALQSIRETVSADPESAVVCHVVHCR